MVQYTHFAFMKYGKTGYVLQHTRGIYRCYCSLIVIESS